jgi:hypothetical protein
VEPIRDFVNTKTGQSRRVRIPERMVAYVSGAVKKKKPALQYSSSSRRGGGGGGGASASGGSAQNGAFVNTMRRATAMAPHHADDTHATTTNKGQQSQSRDTVDDRTTASTVEQQQQQQQQDYRKVLNQREQSEYVRAVKKGYVTFHGCRKKAGSTSSLAVWFRHWCNHVRGCKPNIRLYKATNGHAALDQVVIDISPLALYRRRLAEQQPQQQQQLVADGGGENVMTTMAEMLFQNDLLLYKSQVFLAATKHGMVALSDNNDGDDEDVDNESNSNDSNNDAITMTILVDNHDASDQNNAVLPSTLPAAIMNIGIFQGERSQAKALAKELALQWEIPELTSHTSPQLKSGDDDDDTSSSGYYHRSPNRAFGHDDDDDEDRGMFRSNGRRRPAKTKGLSRHRTRGGGHRQSWY